MIRFTCPSCGMAVSAPDDCVGRTSKCPRCSTPLTVPVSPPVPPRIAPRTTPGGVPSSADAVRRTFPPSEMPAESKKPPLKLPSLPRKTAASPAQKARHTAEGSGEVPAASCIWLVVGVLVPVLILGPLIAYGSFRLFRPKRRAPSEKAVVVTTNSNKSAPGGLTPEGQGKVEREAAVNTEKKDETVAGGKSIESGQREGAEAVPESNQLPRTPATPAQATVGLTDDDITLLKLASVTYYHNHDFVTMDPETYATVKAKTSALVVREAFPRRATGRSNLAYFVCAKWVLAEDTQSNQKEWKQLMRGVEPTWRKTVFDSLILGLKLGLTDGDYPTLAEVRDGPGRHLDSMGDRVRRNMMKQTLNRILFWCLMDKYAETVERYYRPNLGRQDLSSRNVLNIEPEYGDEVGVVFPKSGRPAYHEQSTFVIKITYLGEEPITNCLLIGGTQTTGASDTLTAGAREILRFNEATGAGDDVNRSIEERLKANNVLHTMPKQCVCYVPRLEKGDIIRLPLAPFLKTVVTGATVAAYCDQGYLPKSTVPFSREDYQAWQPPRNRGSEAARLRSPF